MVMGTLGDVPCSISGDMLRVGDTYHRFELFTRHDNAFIRAYNFYDGNVLRIDCSNPIAIDLLRLGNVWLETEDGIRFATVDDLRRYEEEKLANRYADPE
jgi:hypothetical protein